MKPYYLSSLFVGLFLAFLVLLLAKPIDAFSVVVGTVISVVNLIAFSALIKEIILGNRSDASVSPSGRGRLFLLAVLIIIKLGLIFIAIAAACYFLNPIFVTIGLTSLFLGILWKTTFDMVAQHRTLEH